MKVAENSVNVNHEFTTQRRVRVSTEMRQTTTAQLKGADKLIFKK